jgi:hypothetical protein
VAGNRPLGRTQQAVLESLRSHNNGVWTPGCGWLWDTISGTERVMKSLERRGLVTSEPLRNGYRKYTLVPEPDLLARLQASVDRAIASRKDNSHD